jgi:hypothetical protein
MTVVGEQRLGVHRADHRGDLGLDLPALLLQRAERLDRLRRAQVVELDTRRGSTEHEFDSTKPV